MSTFDRLKNEPIAALEGFGRLEHLDIGMDDIGPYIETDDGRGYHAIGYVEHLHPHSLNDANLVDGWLTQDALERARQAIAQILAEKSSLPEEVIATLSIDDGGVGDEPGIEVDITIPTSAGMTVQHAFDTVMYPFWAAMINMTDRGTFNWPYLWSDF